MVDYAIGDLQGCFDPLQRLLDHVEFNEHTDRLWFVGDLVNRGPHSLEVLRFIKGLPIPAIITLGNHDLHFLARLFGHKPPYPKEDTLQALLAAPDAEEMGHWLRNQSILYHDTALNIVMCHAGIAPVWTLTQAKARADELEQALRGEFYREFLTHMYGNTPDHWSSDLSGIDSLRVICNYFTRMRLCNSEGYLELSYQGTPDKIPDHFYPWYALPNRCDIGADLVFGHWAALQGHCPNPTIHAIDTGCVWGGPLTTLRLQDMQRFEVPGQTRRIDKF